MTSTSYTHWRLNVDADDIAWLELDKANASANTLSGEVLRELDQALRELAAGKRPRGLVIKSGKTTGFVLGADVKEFEHITDAAEGARLATQGQLVLARLEAFDAPAVAAIDGFALGGGLELALACTYRIAVRGYERNIGLPEVQLGIHPGFGGTVRTVELLGAPRALDLMLTGRSLSPVEAHSAGLVDRLVERDELDRAAAELIRSKPARRRAAWYLRPLNLAPARRALASRVRPQVAKRARREHYPAPHALLDLWVRHGARGPAAYAAEAQSVGELLVGRTSKNLVRLFLLRERMRNLAPKDQPLERVHVVGAGVMGGDIAAWCALRGLRVTVQDRAMEFVEPALKRADELFRKRLKEPGAAQAAKQRLVADVEGAQVGTAELVIEAIVENVDAKRELLESLQPKLRDDAIVATNTSSIRLEDMAGALEQPGRFVGLHFFNPVASLPLVEVVRGEQTDDATERRALAFVSQIGKVPLPCRSAPGFVVNRVLMPYMLEALHAHEDGHAFETIDAAAKAFGMPMGPIELADRVGLDVALHVARILGPVLGDEPPRVLEQKVEAGETGVKAGAGFYRYEEGRAQKRKDAPKPDGDLQDRLMLPLLNEAVACYADGVVDDADLLDAGVVFGTGFAPFTGGPLNYARQRGVEAVIERLEALAARHGPRFRPHEGWGRIRPRA
ncbi:MAG: enoyl-CoA hydratase/isomerase family protein [Gammaproteobacteria bacterium]|nr:enoyl-CoA hydratase/isomerase family protein [Gammaproteobacteria bacterium]